MRHARRALLAATTSALLLGPGAPAALAGVTPPAHPVVGKLTVTRTVSPGKPLPRVTLRVDESGVRMVYVQLILTNLDTHSVAAVLSPGWLATWRVLHLTWPAHASVRPGSYQLSVSAHDRRGMALMRGPHTTGATTITVLGSAPV